MIDPNDAMTSYLSIREWFAGLALQGIISAFSGLGVALPDEEEAAENAVDYADALIAALKANRKREES